MHRPLVSLALLLLAAAPATAQHYARPDSAFAFLLGTWAGEARPKTARGELRIYQTETVRVVAGGEAVCHRRPRVSSGF